MSQQRWVKGAAVLGVGTLALGVGLVLTADPDDTAQPTSSDQEITPEATAAEWTDEPIGFAALPGEGLDGTTGGAAGETVTVTTQEELAEYAEAEEPYTILVEGTIEMDPFGETIDVTSDKSIIGVDEDAEIFEGGFRILEQSNVIIRNLTIGNTYDPDDPDGKENDDDAIQIDESHHVWLDHNRFTRAGDGLVDLRLDSDFVTFSWNVFEEHNKSFGIGWTDNLITKVTIHHNWIRETNQRNPSTDNTEAAHLFNNYFQDITGYGVLARGEGKVVVENSFFDSVNDPLTINNDAELVERGNIFEDTTGDTETSGEAFDPTDHYEYELDPAEEVPELVTEGAGPTEWQQ